MSTDWIALAEPRRWAVRALCAGSPADLWFPPRGAKFTRALRQVCRGCPVRADCVGYAMSIHETTFGVWGGTSTKDRRRLLRDGETVTADGDCVLWEAASGDVLIIDGDRPTLTVDEALAALDGLVAAVP